MITLGKTIIYCGFVGFFLSFAAVIGLETYFQSFPRTPQPTLGFIVPHNTHGAYHFVSAQLANSFDWASRITFICFVVIAVGFYLTQDKYGRPK